MNFNLMIRTKVIEKISKKKNMIVAIFILLLITISFFIILKKQSYAAEQSFGRTLCYKQILIDEGDSLWSIASENYTSEWESTTKYVKVIKDFNSLNTYEIYAGSYISIPYYTFIE